MAQEDPEQAPAGWYPDPAGSDQQRWWDGERWTDRLQAAPVWSPEPASGPPPTSPWAIATLVLGIVGAFLLAIVVGLIAKRKIRESGGRLGGDGLATAGMVLGATWGVAAIVVLSLSASGAFDTDNRDDFTGPRREVAVLVDRFERALDEDDGETACRTLLTPAFAERLAASGPGSCPAAVRDAVPEEATQADLDVRRIAIRGARADVEVEEGPDRQRWRVLRGADGRWRVDAIR